MLVNGNEFGVYATGAAASHAALGNRTHVVTSISGSVSADATISVLGGASGTTAIFVAVIDISVEGTSFSFTGLSILGDAGVKVEATSSAGTYHLTMCGHTI
tara:strand:+ start:643 stop:948 length:306 start_codon:yes stop_codon:yes gene_type:complete